jgi:hypothetical protein
MFAISCSPAAAARHIIASAARCLHAPQHGSIAARKTQSLQWLIPVFGEAETLHLLRFFAADALQNNTPRREDNRVSS